MNRHTTVSVGQRHDLPGELTKPEFMLITLSQLPALSMLLKDSMATPPGHVSLFAITDEWKIAMLPSAAAAHQEACRGSKKEEASGGICGILRLKRSHKHNPTAVNSSENQLVNILTTAAVNVPGLH